LGEGFWSQHVSDSTSLEIRAGAQRFTFKPQALHKNFSNRGPNLGIVLKTSLSPHWALTFSYRLGYRLYDTLAKILVASQPPGTIIDTDKGRRDFKHVGGMQLRLKTQWFKDYRMIGQLGYSLVYNDSNNYGSTANRHQIQAVISMQMPLHFNLHLMGRIQITEYPDGRYLDDKNYEPDADENENALIAQLSYPLTKRMKLISQWAVYQNEFHLGQKQPKFNRQTILLGISLDLSY
jgi:hypothetical protein